jgi:hypothetical protein
MSANTPEGKTKNKIKAWLKAHGIWYFMPVGGPFTVHGIPDFVCCAPGGYFIGIEAKAPGKRNSTTPNQDQRLQEIRDHGGVAVVVDDVAQLEELLNG